MTKDLYYTIPEYFKSRMTDHSNVRRVENESSDDFFLYRVHRIKQRDSVLVWLSDAYHFTDVDYESRPTELGSGDYILIAKPEGGGGASEHMIDAARIGVGRIGEFMGALNVSQLWTYEPPTFEEQRARKKRWESRAPKK